MIKMPSAFNLPDGPDVDTFSRRHDIFVANPRTAGLIEASCAMGRRVTDSPTDTDTDTDTDNPRRRITVMQFRNRARLDAACAPVSGEVGTRDGIRTAVVDGLYFCWELKDAR